MIGHVEAVYDGYRVFHSSEYFCDCRAVDRKSLAMLRGINFTCRLYNFVGTRFSDSKRLQ